MQFGVFMFPTDYSIGAVDLGRAAEDHGFESLWVPEHTHIPADRSTPWPGGAELPREYSHALDPLVALGAVSAVTTTLKLGTGVCLVIERDPITLAKEVASVDHLSGGRFLFGVGGGWNLEEMANHGTDPARRWPLLRERVLAMRAIWTQDEAEFHGTFVNFDRLRSWPKPIQRPHPPVLIGGNGPHTLKRVIEYGDGWMPILDRGADIVERMTELARMAAEAGREPLPVSIFCTRPVDESTIERFQAAGASRLIFWLPPAEPEDVLSAMRRCADMAQRYENAAAV
jgi:probable F420-dependent oxidoreductase